LVCSRRRFQGIIGSGGVLWQEQPKRPSIPEEGPEDCTNKPLVIVDRGPWYRWAFERLGLEYRHERFGMRNRVERFFRYLKERTVVFHHKMSARDHVEGITNLKLFLNLFTLYYQAARGR